MKILLVEDDAPLADRVARGLERAGHSVAVAADSRRGLFRALGESWDLLILDGVMPRTGERSVVHTLRQEGLCAAILLLTTSAGLERCTEELSGGADDFLIAPFDFAELEARVAALSRRAPRLPRDGVLRVADLELDLPARALRRGDQPVALKPLEFRLLEYLMRHVNRVVTRQMLLQDLWGERFGLEANVVESQVSRLRAKIDSGRGSQLIHTVRGAGYCLRATS